MRADNSLFVCFLSIGGDCRLTCCALYRLRHLFHAQCVNGISNQREKFKCPVDLVRFNGCALRLHLSDFLLDLLCLKLRADFFQLPDILSVLLVFQLKLRYLFRTLLNRGFLALYRKTRAAERVFAGITRGSPQQVGSTAKPETRPEIAALLPFVQRRFSLQTLEVVQHSR